MRVRTGFNDVAQWRFRGLVGTVLAATLTVTVLQGVPAQAAPSTPAPPAAPQSPAEAVSDDPVPIPAQEPAPEVPVEEKDLPPALPPAPDLPDFDPERAEGRDPAALSRAVTQAALTGKPVEIKAHTTETSISFAQPDGTVKVESAAGPVRTKVDGTWVDVDLTLEFTEDGVQPVAASGEITFSPGGDQPMARLSDGQSATLRLDWDGHLPKPVLNGNTATYRNVLPQVDLVLSATRVGFEQHLVVKKRPNRKTLLALRELKFPLAANGAEVTEGAGGELVVEDDGEVVGTAAAPVMWDARTDPATDEPVALRDVGLELVDRTEPGTDATLVLKPDDGFLAAPDTVYPVTIDPTQALGLLGDTFVQNNIANTPQGGSTELRVGTYNGGAQVDRSLLLFDAGWAFDRVVQSATLSLYEFHSYSCNPRWVDIREAGWFDPNTVTWNSQPWIGGIIANANVGTGYSSACPDNWVGFNMTWWVQLFADARNKRAPVMPLAVMAGSEADSYAWKKFNSANAGWGVPQLVFTYDGRCDQYSGHLVCGGIRDKWHSVGAWNSYLGMPINSETCGLVNGGCLSHFQGGSIYWSPATGAKVVRGGIRDKWASLGWERSFLGYPTSDEICGLTGGGCYSHFQGGSIYWSPATGPKVVLGSIRAKWQSLGSEKSFLGYPITDEVTVPGRGWYSHFQGGSIYAKAGGGTYFVKGTIRERFAALGSEASYLGFPITDETVLPGRGSYSHFEGGSIYASAAAGVGTHDVHGPIRDTWASLGSEAGWLGFPSSDPVPIAGGTRSEFEGGNIVFDQRTNATIVGAGVLKHPTQFQRVTQARTQLQATAKLPSGGASYDGVRFQWREYSLTPADGWTDVDPGTLRLPDGAGVTDTWLPLTDADGGKASTLYTWNATTSIPADGLVQVRACLRVAGTTTERCTGVTQITVDRAGLTGANATAEAGPGTVSLLTGAYAIAGRDAEVTSPHGNLAAARYFASNDPDRVGPLGPGWRFSLAVDEAGADYEGLVDRTDAVLVTRSDGTQLSFVRKSSAAVDVNNYVAEGEASVEGATLTFVPEATGTPSSYVLKDLDGDTVTFRRADGGKGHLDGAVFRVEKVEAIRGKAGSTEASPALTTVLYTTAGNPHVLLAPTDAGAACPDPTTTAQPIGCRALEFVYTGTGPAERLQEIRLRAHGAAAPDGGLVTADTQVQGQIIPLARYAYGTNGRLQSVADPRSGQKVSYEYRADGRLGGLTPTIGTATWALEYDDRQLPRLVSATFDDGPDALPAQTTSVRYDVPRDGSSGLPALTATEIARWGQRTVPTDLTAVFDPVTLPDASPTDAQWRGAQLFALDVNGRVINTAAFGGTADQDTGSDQAPAWRIGTTEYDVAGRGNVVRSLTAGNRDRALAAETEPAAEAGQARLLDTVNIWSADGMDLLRSYGPARWVVKAAGDKLVSARPRTTTTYDTGNEALHVTPGKSRHVPLRQVTDAVEIHAGLPVGSDGTDPALPSLDGASRVTVLEYGTAIAWQFGVPSASRTDPGGGAAEVVRREILDTRGRQVSRTLPSGGSSTATPATTTKVYYAASGSDTQCSNAAWAGWLCKVVPGGAPSSGFPLLTMHIAAYDVYGQPTRTVETAAGISRVTDVSSDAAGRVRRNSVTGTGPEAGLARRAMETTYTGTGAVHQTRLLAPDGTVAGDSSEGTASITREYDAYGRLTEYTDGTGLVTSYTYDQAGRPSRASNNHGTRTVTYDANGERGSFPTGVEVSGVGSFTARYGADGALVRENLPGGFSTTTLRDAAGKPVSVTHRKAGVDGSNPEWLRSTATMTGFEQVDSYSTVAATGTSRATRFGYDGLGRMTSATDFQGVTSTGLPTGSSCTRRYTFDVNSNRTALTQASNAGAPQSACATAVPAQTGYAYDNADRLLPTGPRTSLRYDGFGRTRTLASADTANLGGDVLLDYYVDDLVASMSQAGRTAAFALDASTRRTVRTDTDTASPGVTRRTVSHYAADDDNPDVVTEPDNSVTRNILSFGGLAATVTRSGTAGAAVTLQLTNLHGDVAATVPMTATSPSELRLLDVTEYGAPRTAPAAGAEQPRYGYLGTYQRDSSTPGGLSLMGVRLYAPTLGRFLTTDPVEGGSANDYDYVAGDPVNVLDLDGRCPWCVVWIVGALIVRVAAASRAASAAAAAATARAVATRQAAAAISRSEAAAAARASSARGGVAPNQLGQAGQRAVPGVQNTKTFQVRQPNGTTRGRTPDRYDPVTGNVGEVKNVSYLNNSNQFRDYQQIASQNGGTLTIWVRGSTIDANKISRPLLAWAARNNVTIARIPGT